MPYLFKNPGLSFDFIDGTSSTSTNIKGIHLFTASVNSGALAAVSEVEVSTTKKGLAVGDIVLIADAPSGEEARIAPVGCRVTAADTFVVRMVNHTAAAATGGADTYSFLWIDLT